MRLSAAQLSALLSGMEWTRGHAPRVTKPEAVQRGGDGQSDAVCGENTSRHRAANIVCLQRDPAILRPIDLQATLKHVAPKEC